MVLPTFMMMKHAEVHELMIYLVNICRSKIVDVGGSAASHLAIAALADGVLLVAVALSYSKMQSWQAASGSFACTHPAAQV